MEKLQDAPKFLAWKKSLARHGVSLNSVTELHSVRKRNGEILFSMIHLDAKDSQGVPLLPVALLRGHFVSILTVLIEQETGKEYFLMVNQIRVADGDQHFEHPAGMLDQESDLKKVAQKELEEETGLHIPTDQLIQLNQEPLFSSPGLCDEGGYYFFCELSMSREEIESFRGKQTGSPEEMEFIRTDVFTPTEVLSRVKNANGLLNYFLWLEYRKKNAS